MPEALFYHLTAHPLERALPVLLERTLAKGWRATVRTGSTEGMDSLNTLLWTYRDDSFLPHGSSNDAYPASQPVYLTTGTETPNNPQALFIVDGADTDDFAANERVIVMFDGADETAVDFARKQWMRASKVVPATYWRQTSSGGWEKAHETEPSTG